MENSGIPARIGRFRIVRELDRGPHGRTYLADDPDGPRRVTVKVLPPRPADPSSPMQQRFREVRSLARFRHPNIVPVVDANEDSGMVFIAYEYAEGISLKDLVAHRGRLDAPYAARTISRVLEGLAHAHESGVVHGDLAADRILIDRRDVPRLTDFGLAALKGNRTDAGPGGPAADLFALGLVFYEILAGKPLFDAGGDANGLYRIAFDPEEPPSARNETADGRLDRIVMRAIERQPENRYGSAAEMKRDLDGYLNPGKGPENGEAPGKSHSTVDFLIRRMSRMKDFPTFSQNISEINQKTSTARSSSVSASDLANVILRDYSLTSKLLKLVNSAFYGQLSGKITTVTRAVVVLGFEKVRMTAVGLMLFDQLQNHSQVADLKDSAVASFLSGLIAGKLSEGLASGGIEEGFICGMLHNLGKYLVILYFPEEYGAIRDRMAQKGLNEQDAAVSVLGVAYEDLAMEILRTWNFPKIIVGSLCRLPEGRVARPKSDGDILKVVSNCSNALCEIVRTTEGAARAEAFRAVAARFHDAIHYQEKQLTELILNAAQEMLRYADALKIDVRKSDLLNRIAQEPGAAGTQAAAPSGPGPGGTAAGALPSSGPGRDAELNDILYMILETMYRGFGFQRVVLCVMDARTARMTARFAFGADTPYIINHFSFRLAAAGDTFNDAIVQNREIVVNDADDPAVRDKIPEWYRRLIGAPAFVAYPIVIRNKPIGIFYADKGRKGDILAGNQSVYMKTLCNQAILAVKQAR